jgi:hypothetical protein
VNTVSPEIIAAKLDMIRAGDAIDLMEQSLDHRRLRELILYLQSQPDFTHFTERLVETFPSRFGTKTMLALAGQNSPWTLEQKMTVARELPHQRLPFGYGEDRWLLDAFWKDRCFSSSSSCDCAPGSDRESVLDAIERDERPALEKILHEFDAVRCQKLCQDAALKELPSRLLRFCFEPQSPLKEAWYLRDMVTALIELMDADAAKSGRSIVSTQISRESIAALEYAISAKALAWIETDGRFAEDETITTWCAGRPGKVRVVDTPSENCDGEWYRALAKAIGFDTGFKPIDAETRSKIVSFAQSSRLLFVFRNAQFLLPSRYSKNTQAPRLSWIDTRFLQKRVPVAFIATQGAFESASAKFKAATHAGAGDALFEVWLKEKALKFTLPKKLDPVEFVALAQSYYPEMDAVELKQICAKAFGRLYIADVQKIGGLAQFYASAAGREVVTEADVDSAVAKVIPSAVVTVVPAATPTTKPPRQVAVGRRSRPPRPPVPSVASPLPTPALEMPSREITPAATLIPS